MELDEKRTFVRASLMFAISGTLNLRNGQLRCLFEECAAMSLTLADNSTFIVATECLAEIWYRLSEFEKSKAYYNDVLNHCKQNGNKEREGFTYSNLGNCCYSLGQYDKAIEHHKIHLKIARQIKDKAGEAGACFNLGTCYRYLGQYSNAIEHYEMHVNISRQLKNKDEEESTHGLLGVCYGRLGQYDKAIEYHEKHLKITRQTKNVEGEGSACGNLGNCYYFLGQYNKAIEYHEKRLKITRQTKNKEGEGSACGNLGDCYYSLELYEKAIEHYEMHLDISRQIKDKTEQGEACNKLGNCYYFLAQYDKAVEYHEMHLIIARQIKNKGGGGNAYGNLGNCFYSLGQYDKAIKHHEKHLAIARQTEDKAGEGSANGNLGTCYDSLGQYDKAMQHHEMRLNIAREIKDQAEEGAALGNLGSCYGFLGRYDKAIEHHQLHLNITRKIKDKAGEGRASGNLGSCYFFLGKYDKAVEHHKIQLNIARQIKDKVGEGRACGNLGECFRSRGQYDKAIEHHEMQLNIAREIKDKAGEVKACGNLGGCYCCVGNYDKAIDYNEITLRISREIKDKTGEGSACRNLGDCYAFQGRNEKAIKLLRTSIKIAKQTGSKQSESYALYSMGRCYLNIQHFDQAEQFLKDSLQRFEDIFQNTPQQDEMKISFRDTFLHCYNLLVEVLLQQGKTNDALLYSERGRARALAVLMLLAYRLDQFHNRDTLLDLTDICKVVTKMQSTVLFLKLQEGYIYTWIIQQDGCIQFMKNATVSSTKTNSTPNEDFTLTLIKLLTSDLRNSINRETCEDRSLQLLYLNTETRHSDKTSILVSSSVVEKSHEDSITIGSSTETSDASLSYRNIIIEENDEEEGNENKLLQNVYQVILKPVRHLVEGKNLVIVPDGQLNLVPFAALIDEHGHHVAESLQVRIFPSLTTAKMVIENRVQQDGKVMPLIVGDPHSGSLPRLPCADKEARIVAKLFKSEPLIGEMATKENVLRSIENASLIHIAAHGDMKRGEILLAPNPTDATNLTRPKREDKMLVMADLESKRLKANLVVLSCCHSASGEITADGVVGIARAFLGAGARSVLVALWAIADGATLHFMERFYENLTQGESAAESLNKAMATMRESRIFNDPRHWAPFVLIGDDVTVC